MRHSAHDSSVTLSLRMQTLPARATVSEVRSFYRYGFKAMRSSMPVGGFAAGIPGGRVLSATRRNGGLSWKSIRTIGS